MRVLKLRFLVTRRLSKGNTRIQCVPRLRVGFPFSEQIEPNVRVEPAIARPAPPQIRT